MRLVYLIRHASPEIQPSVPAPEWVLSERGQREAGVLAGTAESWGIEALYASTEPKAQATALILGDPLGLPVNVVPAFDELRIPPDWIPNSDDFNELVRDVLAGETPRGCESAEAAAARFAEGMALVAQGRLPAGVVSHGRVLTAYLSRHYGVSDAFDYWRSIPMPGWAVIDLDAPSAGVLPFAP